jgi:hypothetical protein
MPYSSFMQGFLKLPPTVRIRIVADCGTLIIQVTTKFYAGYNAHIYYYFGYYFYKLLCVVVVSPSSFILFNNGSTLE